MPELRIGRVSGSMAPPSTTAFAEHGAIETLLPTDGSDCEEILTQFANACVDVDPLVAQLRSEGAKSFVSSWNDLMGVIASKSAELKKTS